MTEVAGGPALVRVVIADDHPMMREGTAAFLRTAESIEVVGVAADGKSCLELVRRTHPDVLVLDLRLPDIPGVEVARRVRREQPRTAIVVMTGYDYQAYRRELGRMGVAAVLAKSSSGAEIAEAVRLAASTRGARSAVAAPELSGDPDALTPREHQVLELLAAGLRNPEIAAALGVTLKTVEFHVSNVLGKLHARSRTDAVLRAQDLGLIAPHLLPPDQRSVG